MNDGVRPRWSIGFDIGSTYIDLMARSDDAHECGLKHPRGSQSPAAAALLGLRSLLAAAGIEPSDVNRVVHGSTIVTNALVQQQPAKVAWLTTRGFADVLLLGRQQRLDLYSQVPLAATPQALFSHALCLEIGGRIDVQGAEVEALDLDALEAAIHRIADTGVSAVGIGLLFAHLNPAHEVLVAQRLQQRLPGLAVALSHETDGRSGEYERFLATFLDACVRPAAGHYLDELAAGLSALGLPAARMMRSDAVTVAMAQARRQPLTLALSGPAAALIATASLSGSQTAISMDVGGTTTDVGLVRGSEALYADTLAIGDSVVRVRAADIACLPVGGGSVVRVLPGGALRVGPQSSGSCPGPVAYGLGGTTSTLTDALLLLNRLPSRLAGGIALNEELARESFRPLAESLELSVTGLAQAVVEAATVTIADGMKRHAFGHGFDPSSATLFAIGGGGGQHGAEVATRLGIQQVCVPADAGLLAAHGLLLAQPEMAITLLTPTMPLLTDELLAALQSRVEASGAAVLACPQPRWTLSLGPQGQQSTIDVVWHPSVENAAALSGRLGQTYQSWRGHAMAGDVVCHALRCEPEPIPVLKVAFAGKRAGDVWPGIVEIGNGPAALFGAHQTAWVPPGWQWRVEAGGDLLLTALRTHG